MASSARRTHAQFISGEYDANSDDDDDDEDEEAAERRLDDRPMTSQNCGPLPVTPRDAGTCGGYDQPRQSQAVEPGRCRRASVMQYIGKQQSTVCVVEEERSTDDDPEDDDVISARTSFAGVDDGISHDGLPHFVVDYPRNARMRQPRMSLLGKPLGYRASRRDTRTKHLQNLVYNFLERPKTCPAISYHVTV